jgi:hypothetical protein
LYLTSNTKVASIGDNRCIFAPDALRPNARARHDGHE